MTYKFGKILRIDLNEEANFSEIDSIISKTILSDTLSAMTNKFIDPELLSSYLTAEYNELPYSKSYAEKSNNFNDIHKGNQLTDLQVNSTQTNINNNNKESFEECDREENEIIDLDNVDLTKKYVSNDKSSTNNIKLLKKDNILALSESISEEVMIESFREFSIFQLNYNFETSQFIDLSVVPKEYLITPTEEDIYNYCKQIIMYSKMEKEIPIIALIYIEKLMKRTGLLMNAFNWRRFIFISFIIASKVILIII